MKSSLAAMIVATESFVAKHPTHKGRIGFLITADEEGPAVYGTRHVIDTLMARGESIDWCVVGEPSSTSRLGDTIKTDVEALSMQRSRLKESRAMLHTRT